MISLKDLKEKIEQDSANWSVSLMDFVDDFRYYKDLSVFREPFNRMDDRWAALLAATTEELCREQGVEPPEWIHSVPASKDPWFVSGLENLKAIALAESPLPFRLRKIFVLENFLSRV
jgi:hypothetical protein